jgi:hypothetical protein
LIFGARAVILRLRDLPQAGGRINGSAVGCGVGGRREVRVSDPRLGGGHLDTVRWERYDAAVDSLLDARGAATADADPLIWRPAAPGRPAAPAPAPPGGTYFLVGLADGRRHRLRVGVNAVGRFRENDLVLFPNHISRRHCLIMVHATGGCEVSDTASRNGTWVNRCRVTARADLFPGDRLDVCDQRFVLAWLGPDGQVLPADEPPDTLDLGGPSLPGV